jgi:succinate dehydrogenase / fumarate reductase cytochrome b subunit
MSYTHFMLRRLHSLFGIIPLGFFILEHFAINSFAFKGAEAYNTKVEFLRSLPFLFALEIGFIFIPILYHAIYGLIIIYTGESNVRKNRYVRNWMYSLQRVSAFFVLGFVGFHVITLRFLHDPERLDFFTLLADLFRQPAFLALYIVGVAATIFHFCNGVCTFLMTWGITVGPLSQKIVGYAMILAGLALAVVIFSSVYGFIHVPA